MSKSSPEATPKARRYFLATIKRTYVYAFLLVAVLATIGTVLITPHNLTLHYASAAQIDKAHQRIITKYFQKSTNCENDNIGKTDRVKAFNKYFKVNQFANRALIRGCNDHDTMLATDKYGEWQLTDVNIIQTSRQNPAWQKECLLDDITKPDTVVRPENSSIDQNNLEICHKLRTISYISVSIHYNF